MSKKTAEEIRAALAQPFAPADLEWRLQHVNTEKPYGIAVPYVTNRAIQNRLDDVVGPDNWYNDYRPWHNSGKKESQLCGLSIYFEEKKLWITKWDGAEDTDIESIKGGLSDSMKRAAVQWGIGRILYEMDAVLVDVEQRGKTWVIAKKEQTKLDNAYLELLKRKGLSPAPTGGTQDPKQPQERPPAQSGNKKTTPKPAAKEEKKPTEPQAQSTDSIPADEPIYTVISAKVQNGMSGASTRVVLEGADKKRVNAYVRGAHPELTEGLQLSGVRMTFKKQDTVAFYILEAYQTIAMPQVA